MFLLSEIKDEGEDVAEDKETTKDINKLVNHQVKLNDILVCIKTWLSRLVIRLRSC